MKKQATPYEKTSHPLVKIAPINKDKDTDKENKKARKGRATFNDIIAERTEDAELREALGEFVRMRERIRKPLTDYAFKLRLDKLWRLGGTDAERTAIVQQSVGASWQDFYELKDETKGNKGGDKESDYGFDPAKYNYF